MDVDVQQIAVTQAYLYRGGWVADCPRDGCANTESQTDPVSGAHRGAFLCSNCGMFAVVDWPPDDFRALAEAVVALRPVPDTRNWYPAGHPNATAWRIATGQTISELRQENLDHGVAAG